MPADSRAPCLLPRLPEELPQHRPAVCPLRPQMVHETEPPPVLLSAAPPRSLGVGAVVLGDGIDRPRTGRQRVAGYPTNGQVHQLIESEGGVPAGQLPTDVLSQAATIVVDQGPRQRPGSGSPERTPGRSSSPASDVRDIHLPLYPQVEIKTRCVGKTRHNKWKMKNGSAMARRAATSTAKHRPNNERHRLR